MKFIISVLFCFLIISCQAEEMAGDNSETFHQLLDDYFRTIITRNPDYGSHLGLDPTGDYPYDKSKLTDNSEATYQHEMKIVREYFEFSENYCNLSPTDDLELSVFQNYLQKVEATDKYRYQYYLLNHLHGFHYQLISLFTENHTINNLQDAEDYLSRLEQLDTYFDNIFIELKKREEMNMFPSKIILEHLQNIVNDFLEQRPVEIIYYTYFIDRIDDLPELDKTNKQIYLARALDEVNTKIVPNYKKISDHIEKLKEKADDIPGVWKLPDGDNFYQFCLQNHTTTNLTAEEIHQIGLKEVKRIQAEILKRFEELGFTEGETFGEIEGKYWHSLEGSEFNYLKDDNGRQQALEDYLQIIEETEKLLPAVFSKIPSIPVTVRPVPPHKEQYSGQYYDDAPLDGSRPAIFYTNLSWLPKKPGMQTLLYHETIPGHHLQIAYAQELADIPIYRNFTFFTAFIEGWALYAEKLAFEQGWYKNIYSELGYLNSELFRAARLVVDTGIHYKRWDREQAADYMKKNLGWASYGEIDRYSVWPGQACAYKIGELKILELREKAKSELGEKFDLREFHNIILQHGAIPLNLLEDVVDNWLLKQK
ncbi:MAG: DUF885 domain-containing protein [Candidatus Cloacimonetes bacterium]|jgi:uncharacterized protein (DUF885 family)|nr:DUF885 domain-containing protein [Candidatus Cloacimonadota bacterium]